MSLLKRRFDQLRHAWRNLSKHWLAVVASFLSLAAILALIDSNWLSAAICSVLSLAQWDAYWRERRSWAGRVHERWSRRDATIWWLALSTGGRAARLVLYHGPGILGVARRELGWSRPRVAALSGRNEATRLRSGMTDLLR